MRLWYLDFQEAVTTMVRWVVADKLKNSRDRKGREKLKSALDFSQKSEKPYF